MRTIKTMLIFLFLTLAVSFAHANIQVFPTRVNLSKSKKTSTISIRLRSDKPETFRISTMFYEMAKDGSVRQRPDLARSSESAAPYIRFSPKRVTLQPNVEQIVRIRVKNVAALKKEIRTHLYFRPEEKEKKPIIAKNKKGKSSFELTAKVAVAIPVIITPKPLDKDFALSDFKLFQTANGPKFKVDLTKNTEGFLYGDVHVYKVKKSKKTLVALAKGISSYIDHRSISYPIQKTAAANLTKGLYRLEFNEHSQVEASKGTLKSIDYMYY